MSSSALRSSSTCSSSRMNGGNSRRIAGSALVPARMLRSSSAAWISLAGRAVRRPSRNPAPCDGGHGPDDDNAGADAVPRHPAHALQQRLGFDGLDDRFDGRAGHRPAAKSGAQRIEFHGGGDRRRHQQRRHGDAVAQRLGGGDHVGLNAIQIGSEATVRRRGPCTALDLIEWMSSAPTSWQRARSAPRKPALRS